MVTILEPVSERRNFRLKNRKLQTVRKEVVTCTGPMHVEEKLEDLLCSTFGLQVLFSLLPQELANLEATCRCSKDALNGDNAALIWVASAYALSRGRRVELPVKAFAGMSLPEMKYTLANMKYARGLPGSPVPLSDGTEFNIVSAICNRAAAYKAATANSAVRVVTGRLNFRQQGLMLAPMYDEEDDDMDMDSGDDDMYFSNDISFCWTGHGSERKGTMLVASLGLLNGANVLEISSVIKPLKSPIALSVDVHLVSPLWPEGLKAEGVKVRVDGSCSGFDLPDLDITDEETRKILTTPGGLLCILAVHNLANGAPEMHSPPVYATVVPVQTRSEIAPQAITTSNLNALALSVPYVSLALPPPKCVY